VHPPVWGKRSTRAAGVAVAVTIFLSGTPVSAETASPIVAPQVTTIGDTAATSTSELVTVDLKLVTFSGMKWYARDTAGEESGPGPCQFDPKLVTITKHGYLKLKAKHDTSGSSCSQIHPAVGTRKWGYGTYEWVVQRSGVKTFKGDPVLGLFTWSNSDKHAHRELDIEIARWGTPVTRDPLTWFSVQKPTNPATAVTSHVRTPNVKNVRMVIRWAPNKVTFKAGNVTKVVTKHVPPQGGGVMPVMNLWLTKDENGKDYNPSSGTMVIKSFKYTKLVTK
jgi:hypothetical protein